MDSNTSRDFLGGIGTALHCTVFHLHPGAEISDDRLLKFFQMIQGIVCSYSQFFLAYEIKFEYNQR